MCILIFTNAHQSRVFTLCFSLELTMEWNNVCQKRRVLLISSVVHAETVADSSSEKSLVNNNCIRCLNGVSAVQRYTICYHGKRRGNRHLHSVLRSHPTRTACAPTHRDTSMSWNVCSKINNREKMLCVVFTKQSMCTRASACLLFHTFPHL